VRGALEGRVAIVTGAGRGIDRQHAEPDERWTITDFEKEAAHVATVEFELNRPYWG
jgi:NAD(P)-dependent dehydrogenase (short-subunit alcohol dehydrogenase family)